MITMQGWSSVERISRLAELRAWAKALRADGDYWWSIGEKQRSTRCHAEAGACEREAHVLAAGCA